MKNLIRLMVVAVLLCVIPTTTNGQDTIKVLSQTKIAPVKIVGWKEHRTIVPYREPLCSPPYRTIERLPHPSYDGFHFLPHLYVGPNQDGGFGGHFGLRFGTPFSRSHGFQFGIGAF